VEIAGEKKDPCAKATSSDAFCVWFTLCAFCLFLCWTSIHALSFAVVFGILACQRLSFFVRIPFRIVSLLCVMLTVVSVNVAVHCASHSWPTDSSDVLPSSGKMCAVRASTGKFGKSNSAVCVAIIVWLFGNTTLIPLVVFCWLMVGAVTARKCPVHLVSTIRWWLVCVEGPSGVVVHVSLTMSVMLLTAACASLGSPRPQASSMLGVSLLSSMVLHFFLAVLSRGTHSYMVFSPGWRRLLLFPSHMLINVASLLCPFAGNLQLSLLWAVAGLNMAMCMMP